MNWITFSSWFRSDINGIQRRILPLYWLFFHTSIDLKESLKSNWRLMKYSSFSNTKSSNYCLFLGLYQLTFWGLYQFTGCPERLGSLILWRYSKPTWVKSCTTWSRWTCSSRAVWLGGLQRSLPTPAILWFCDLAQHTTTTYQFCLI